jgi:hypothetical protein
MPLQALNLSDAEIRGHPRTSRPDQTIDHTWSAASDKPPNTARWEALPLSQPVSESAGSASTQELHATRSRTVPAGRRCRTAEQLADRVVDRLSRSAYAHGAPHVVSLPTSKEGARDEPVRTIDADDIPRGGRHRQLGTVSRSARESGQQPRACRRPAQLRRADSGIVQSQFG